MPVLENPNLPDRHIEVAEAAVIHYLRSGWVPSDYVFPVPDPDRSKRPPVGAVAPEPEAVDQPEPETEPEPDPEPEPEPEPAIEPDQPEAE